MTLLRTSGHRLLFRVPARFLSVWDCSPRFQPRRTSRHWALAYRLTLSHSLSSPGYRYCSSMDGMSSNDRASLCALQTVRETAEQALNALYQTQSKIRTSYSGSSTPFRFKLEFENAIESLEKCYQKITQVQAQMFAENPVVTQKIQNTYHWTLSQSPKIEIAVDQDLFKSIAICHQFSADPKPERNYHALGYLLPHVNQGFAAVRAITNADDNSSHVWNLTRLNQLLVECNKIEVLVDLIPAALATPVHSITRVSPTQFILDSVEVPSDPEALNRNLAKFASRLEKVKCMANDAVQHSNGLLRHLKLATSGLYYTANPDRARHKSNVVGVDPDIRMIKFMWNLTEHAAGRALYKVTFPKIAQHETFHISPSDLDEEDTLSQAPVKVRYLSPRYSNRVAKNIDSIRNRTVPSCQVFLRSTACFRFSSTASQENSFQEPLDALILHFHGGGFVAQSSYSHQTYTRQWANGTNVAILSVDYRLAPEAQYPAPINDAWLVYRWCLKFGESVLGIDPARIVVAGDSAGGNIAASLVIKALSSDAQPPAGIFVAYPCLCLSPDVFYPSSLSCLDEVMIPYGFLLACIKAYVPEDADPLSDRLLSPALATDDILLQFPPVKIMVGSRDPLLDQSLEFAQRLHLLQKNVELAVYSGFGHGFLSFDNPVVGVPESHLCVVKSIEWLQELTRHPQNA